MNNKGEVVKNVLKTLVAIGLVATVIALPGMAGVINLFNPRNPRERKRLRRTMRELMAKKIVNYYRQGGKDIIEVTDKGRKILLSYDFENIALSPPRKWDGLFRVIIFDIPERKKRARKLFHLKLKEMGLYLLQDSVFITPYECRKEIEYLRNYLFIAPHVQYLLVKNLDDKEKIKRYFNIVQ